VDRGRVLAIELAFREIARRSVLHAVMRRQRVGRLAGPPATIVLAAIAIAAGRGRRAPDRC
jgi:hypothetical protein